MRVVDVDIVVGLWRLQRDGGLKVGGWRVIVMVDKCWHEQGYKG